MAAELLSMAAMCGSGSGDEGGGETARTVHVVPVGRGWRVIADGGTEGVAFLDLGDALDAATALAGPGRTAKVVIRSEPPSGEREARERAREQRAG